MSKAVFQLSDGSDVIASSANTPTEADQSPEFSVTQFLSHLNEDLLSNRLTLPTLPSSAIEALIIINDEASSANDLATVISRDASLTTRLIRYANSPVFRGAETIKAIKPAITRIGFAQAKNAVYAVSMKEVFKTPIKSIEQRMDTIWNRSIKIGAQAAVLANQHPTLDANIALVAGLIHDIGSIPILTKAAEHKELVENPDYLDKVIAKTHCILGSSILEHWKFAQELIDVAAEHEQLDRQSTETTGDYVDLVQVASMLVDSGIDDISTATNLPMLPAVRRLNLINIDPSILEQGTAEIAMSF